MEVPSSVISILKKYYYINNINLLLDKLNKEYKDNFITLNDLSKYRNDYHKQKSFINIGYFKRH